MYQYGAIWNGETWEIPKIKLRSYQIEAVNFIRKRNHSYIALDMGMGKTVVAIEATKRIGRTLVICPAMLKENWRKELIKLQIGPKEILMFKRKEENIRYTITNYERLGLMSKTYNNVIIDEAHYCKNMKTRRTKEVKRLSRKATNKVIMLSGTPMKSRPEELYAQLKILYSELTIDWLTYHKRYCGARLTRYGWWKKGATHKEELAKMLKKIMLVAKKEDYNELPKRIITVIEIDPEGGIIEEEQRLFQGKTNYLEQIKKLKGDKIKFETFSRLRSETELLKAKRIKYWITEHKRTVIMTYHRKTAEELETKNDIMIHGGVTAKKREELMAQWRREEKNNFIGTMASTGIGLTLTESNTMIITGIPAEPSMLFQAMDRIYRIGQEKPVIVKIITIRGSIENELLKEIMKKQELVRQIIT